MHSTTDTSEKGQLDVVRKLLKDAAHHGVGKRYLIQHSAGSGKSNSIAWRAHQHSPRHRGRAPRPQVRLADRRGPFQSRRPGHGGDEHLGRAQVVHVAEEIPARVAADTAYQNAMKHSDKQNARIEHDKALARVIVGLMKDDTELFKQFSDNEGLKRWLTDTIFNMTYDNDAA